MLPHNHDALLAAACTVYGYEASRILGVRQQGNLNEVPDLKTFQALFTFSADDLIAYIKTRPELIEYLLNASLDSRASSAPYFLEIGICRYEVAPRLGYPSTIFEDPTKAAAAYIRAYWRLK